MLTESTAQTGAEISELLDSDVVWQVPISGQKILALFSRNKQVMMEVSIIPLSEPLGGLRVR